MLYKIMPNTDTDTDTHADTVSWAILRFEANIKFCIRSVVTFYIAVVRIIVMED